MVDTVITLITAGERYQDADGIWRTSTQTERDVFARMRSVGRNEFFSAGQAGFRPEYEFVIFAAEYGGEELCQYCGQLYAVYRTYRVPDSDTLELYVQKKVGVSDGE